MTDYLHFSGWEDIEVVDLNVRGVNGERVMDDNGFVRKDAEIEGMDKIPEKGLDPLWVVRATKGKEQGTV